jgi:Trk K+ transport system NAD-binding subunit
MANSITHASLDTILRDSTDHLNNDLKGLGVSISQHLVVSNGVDDGKTLVQFLKGNEESCMILALKKGDGTLIQHPGGKTRLDGNDVIMLISRDNKVR